MSSEALREPPPSAIQAEIQTPLGNFPMCYSIHNIEWKTNIRVKIETRRGVRRKGRSSAQHPQKHNKTNKMSKLVVRYVFADVKYAFGVVQYAFGKEGR